MLKEYDVTKRNIHHNPLLKQIKDFEDINFSSKPLSASPVAGTKMDVFGNARISNGPQTSFDYAKNTPYESPNEMEDSWYKAVDGIINTFEDIMQESINDAVKQSFSQRFQGNNEEFDAVWGRYLGAIKAGSIENPQSIKAIDSFLNSMRKYNMIKEKIMNKNRIIEKALDIGLSFDETKDIVNMFEGLYDSMPEDPVGEPVNQDNQHGKLASKVTGGDYSLTGINQNMVSIRNNETGSTATIPSDTFMRDFIAVPKKNGTIIGKSLNDYASGGKVKTPSHFHDIPTT